MKLITKEITNKIPARVPNGEEAEIIVKFFNPCGAQTWYIVSAYAILENGEDVELSQVNGHKVEDIHLYGFVTGMDFPEWGSVSLKELSTLRVSPFGLGIERDIYWEKGQTVKQLREKGVIK